MTDDSKGMRWAILWAAGLMFIGAGETLQARHHPVAAEDSSDGSIFKVGGLQFTLPAKWQSVPVTSDARVGQWRIPLPHGEEGEGGEVVVIYFGQGVGGDAKENISAWSGLMTSEKGGPAPVEVKNRTTNGFAITTAIFFGTYHQPVPMPGIPPLPKVNFGLYGATVEGHTGNIYWRFTGPAPLMTASLPLFNKILDSVKLQGK
jgi:hypothetical protein